MYRHIADTPSQFLPYEMYLYQKWSLQVYEGLLLWHPFLHWNVTICSREVKFENITPSFLSTVTAAMEYLLTEKYMEGLVQERRNSSALSIELTLSCYKPSIWNNE